MLTAQYHISSFIEYVCVGVDISLKSSVSLPVEAFIDDLFLKRKSFEDTQKLLSQANTDLSWSTMKLKPSKSKSLIISDGKVQHDKLVSIYCSNQTAIISFIINKNPVRFLGRTISFFYFR